MGCKGLSSQRGAKHHQVYRQGLRTVAPQTHSKCCARLCTHRKKVFISKNENLVFFLIFFHVACCCMHWLCLANRQFWQKSARLIIPIYVSSCCCFTFLQVRFYVVTPVFMVWLDLGTKGKRPSAFLVLPPQTSLKVVCLVKNVCFLLPLTRLEIVPSQLSNEFTLTNVILHDKECIYCRLYKL